MKQQKNCSSLPLLISWFAKGSEWQQIGWLIRNIKLATNGNERCRSLLHSLEKAADCKLHSLLYTTSIRACSSCCFPALQGLAISHTRQPQTPYNKFKKGKLNNNVLWLQQLQSSAKSPPNPRLVETPPRVPQPEAPWWAQNGRKHAGYRAENGKIQPWHFSLSGQSHLCALPPLQLRGKTTKSKTRLYLLPWVHRG